jgi:DNA-nicking Smr family endonuclease
VHYIGNDWGSSSQPPKHVTKVIDESSIHLTFLNTDSNDAVHLSIGVSRTLKELFTKYSEEQSMPLRSLRFVFEGKPLFVSSASKKTPEQLGMRDHDVICVSSTIISGASSQTGSAPEPQKKVQRKKSTKKRCNKNKHPKSRNTFLLEKEDPKIAHSEALTKLFEEAEPQFRVIRQQLNNLALERTLPKTKSLKRKVSPSTQQVTVFDPSMDGLAGKAGKTSYVIHVGEVNNLYKSSKKYQAQVPQPQMIDLHGYTQHEALQKLDESLPVWEKYAMEGSYPFVAPVVIICGGGNQILSETVSHWIKENDVSNAPCKTKNTFASAA